MTTDLRATKRKFDQALLSLDDALSSSPVSANATKAHHDLSTPIPSKIRRSLYGALPKYGVSSARAGKQLPSLSTLTPHLSAILARSQPKQSPAPPSSPAPLPSTSEYRPSSLPCFLARLATFKLSTYANKPSVIDSVAASKAGWTNHGKDRLVCGLCHSSFVIASRDGMSRDASNTLLERQRVGLVENHKNGCPWRTRQCDGIEPPTLLLSSYPNSFDKPCTSDSIYRIPLKAPAATVKTILSNAECLEPLLTRPVDLSHPLDEKLLQSVMMTLSADYPHNLSQESLIISLFGWTPAPPATSTPSRQRLSSFTSASRATTPSISRTASPAPESASVSHPGTPVSHSRILSTRGPTSLLPKPRPTTATTAPSTGPILSTTTSHGDSISAALRRPMPRTRCSSMSAQGENGGGVVICGLCQRRVGLWVFTNPATINAADAGGVNVASISPVRAERECKKFDVLAEHRSYCPYVVRSTEVPSLPSLPIDGGFTTSDTTVGSSVEGWKAVLSVLLRYKVSDRLQKQLPRATSSDVTATDFHGDSEIRAMIQGVKKHGGRDLLKYVQGLLR